MTWQGPPEALGILANWVLPLILGSTDRITAPEVTGKPEGVRTGGIAPPAWVCMGLIAPPKRPLGPVANGGLNGGPLTSDPAILEGLAAAWLAVVVGVAPAGVLGAGGALLARCCWNWGDNKGGPGLTKG